MKIFRKFIIHKKSAFLRVLAYIHPKEADFEVEILKNRHLLALGGEKVKV